jgi:hypothetical protein
MSFRKIYHSETREVNEMGNKYNRQIRREVSSLFENAVVQIKMYVEKMPLKARFILAVNILFKKKFECYGAEKNGKN